MGYQFPKSIKAARVATFISTAAWIQGTSASEVSLPEEALDNFLKRHGISQGSKRQAPPPEEPEEESEPSESSVESDPETESGEESSEGSSAESPDSAPSEAEDDGAPDNPDSAQANVAADPQGRPEIVSSDTPTLSTGAKAAIGVWVTVAVLAIGVLAFFLYRRRKRARMQEAGGSMPDEEIARAQEPMAEKGAPPSVIEPVHLRGGELSRAPSGQWVATPPWQEETPTWRDSQPWRQSPMSTIAPPVVGLPAHPKPGAFRVGDRQAEFDRRTEYTAETESTIFAYR
ncbi:hypothetical protein F4779DRAFT_133998 [Xylariaceae sp. FL0662B]|nr:hypothetical protein F4779DRAFT_133998 [Xylariaceae sp. FL0662B]